MANRLEEQIEDLLVKGRVAMDLFQSEDQANVDMAVRALAWAIYKPEHSRLLAEMAVEDTGLGNVESKITKNTRKTFGTLRDLLRAKTVGVYREQSGTGYCKIWQTSRCCRGHLSIDKSIGNPGQQGHDGDQRR